MSFHLRLPLIIALFAVGGALLASATHAQIALQTCEDLKITKKQYVAVRSRVLRRGGIVHVINLPGKYFVRMVNYYDKSQVWATTDFSVGEDTVGPRATGNTAVGQGKVTVCKEIDDNWKCVGLSNEWKANVPFNVLFENPTAASVDFIGIVFHKQDAKGRDVEFVNEYQQNMGETNRKYATVGEQLRLPVGVYSVYIIDWRKRESLEHNGNLTEYFAKTTLTVK